MNIVGPIKREDDIEQIKEELLNHSYRDYFLFVLGINTGMKFSDLLNLKFNQLLDKGQVVSTVHINNLEYPINENVKDCFEVYCSKVANYSSNNYIFQSRKGNEPIDRSHAYRIISDAARKVGIDCKVGTQTLRKTFGYHYFKKYNDVKFLQKLFNHNSSKKTLEYIGIDLIKLKNEKKEITL